MNDENLINDILPNNGEAFHQDDDDRSPDEIAEQQAEQAERHTMRTAGVGLVDQLLAWFDNEIKATDSVKAVKAYADSNGIAEPVVLEAFHIVRTVLETKREELEALKEEHLS